jgi:hypothetical protein
VLFPRLCTSVATAPEEEFIAVGFTPDQYKVITESENASYKIRFRLLEFFEEMLVEVPKFNRGSYNRIFLEAFEKHKELIDRISNECDEASKDERPAVMQEIASILPDYVKSRLGTFVKRRENVFIDHNMNMAIYIIPVLTYRHDMYCEKVAHMMVDTWNEKQISALNLGFSSYEGIANGFKKKLCYITTAVCEQQNKPDDCHELTILRDYRDSYLLQTEEGRALVEEYYDIAPGLVMIMDMQNNREDIYTDIYERYLLPCIQYIESDQKEACAKLYQKMVRTLQNQYFYS